jgi:hypothetical protein
LPQEEWLFEMNKTFQYRLYPTKNQQTRLNKWLARCCETYNAALQERRDAYRIAGISVCYAHQCAELPACKEVRPELAEVNSQVLQDVLKLVDRAFNSFFRRVKEGQQPGYPRFRSHSRYQSLTFKQYHNSFDVQWGKKGKGTLILSKLGHLKMVMHRPLNGLPKTAILKRTLTGKWFVSISVECELEADALPASEEAVGIDVGLKTFVYLSTGEQIDNPRFFRQEEQALARAHRKLSKAHQGTPQREKRRKVVAGKLHPATGGLSHQRVRVHRGGSTGSAQYDPKPPPSQEYRRCGMVVIFRTAAQQCGGSWPSSGARASGLYVTILFELRASPGDAPFGAGVRVSQMWSRHRSGP